MRSLLPANILAGLALLCLRAEGAPFHRSGVATRFFGFAEQSTSSVAQVPRGGEEAVVEEEPEILYLPGLLDVALKKSKQVS